MRACAFGRFPAKPGNKGGAFMTLASFWNGAKAPLRENKGHLAMNRSTFFRRMLKGTCKKAVIPILFSAMFVFPAIKVAAQREMPLPKAQHTHVLKVSITVTLGTHRAALHKSSHLKWHRTRLTDEWWNILADGQRIAGATAYRSIRYSWPFPSSGNVPGRDWSFSHNERGNGFFTPRIDLPADYAFRARLFDIDAYPRNERTHYRAWLEIHPQAHGYLDPFDPNRGKMQPFQGVTLPSLPVIPTQHKHNPNHAGMDRAASLAGIAPAFSLGDSVANKYIDTAAIRRFMKEMPNLTQLSITGKGGQRFVGVLKNGNAGSTFEIYKYSDYCKMMGLPVNALDATAESESK